MNGHLRVVAEDAAKVMTGGAEILDQVSKFIAPYVVFPSPHCLTAVTLWIAHTHVASVFYVTPRLILDSAEPGSGKTRVLELIALLCHKPEMMLSPTTAAIFRMLSDEEEPISLLFDETDAIFSMKNAGNYEDLRALLNAGYKRGATIPRCVGDASKMKVQRFKVFAPVALAGIAGGMPATVTTRGVTIHMRKRARTEKVQAYRERDAEIAAVPVADALHTWMESIRAEMGEARPVMPEGVEDRPAEVWEALLAIADAAGGEWARKAREACSYFVTQSGPGPLSVGERLLKDMRDDVFTEWNGDGKAIKLRTGVATAEILARLVALEEAPWSNINGGKALDASRLAREMKRYQVYPSTFRDEASTAVKGYQVGEARSRTGETSIGLADVWERHLAPQTERSGNSGNSGNGPGQSVTAPDPVTAVPVTAEEAVTPLTCEVTAVTAVTEESTLVHKDQLTVPGTPPIEALTTPVAKPARAVRPKCQHCRKAIPKGARTDAKYCKPACKTAAYAKRKKTTQETS